MKKPLSTPHIIRQVHVVAGLLTLTASILALVLDPRWAFLTVFIGVSLLVSGFTGFCGMTIILSKLPWNR